MSTRARRPRRSGWKWAIPLLLLVAGAVFLRGFFPGFGKKNFPPTAFYEVKRADMLISIKEPGALRALNETVVRSSLDGYNRVIHLVPEGAYVKKGELLVELDSSGLRDRLNEQELSYQQRLFQMLQASGNLKIQKSLAESQIKDAELKVENALIDLEKYRDGDAPLLIKTIEARTGVLAEQVRIATERLARTEELVKTGNATKSELEADELILKREQVAFTQYQEDLRLVKKFDQPNQLRLLQSNLEQAIAELARVKQRTSNEIAEVEADLKTSKRTIEFLEESLETQRDRLENAKIFAPQNGLVVYAAVSPFQMGGDDMRRDEGRSRSGRDRGPRSGGDDRAGEFRGGGRRGGRGMDGGSDSSRGGSSSSSSTASSATSGGQRSGSGGNLASATDSSGAGSGTSGSGSSGGGGGGSSGGRSGGSGGGGSGAGQTATSVAGAFASYPSLRPSSAFGGSSAGTNSASSGGSASANAGTSSSMSSTGAQTLFSGGINQSSSRERFSMNSMNFDFFGTPGILEEGTMVRQRQELIRLPDVSKMLAEVKIEESRVGQVKVGMTAYVEVENVPNRRFKGTVKRVAFLPDSQASWMNPNVKVYPADVLVDEELPMLKPGVSASAEIIITNLTKVLSVPIQTVARLRGENVCFVKKGSRVIPIPVVTGWFNDSFIEVTSGLKEGDHVLLAAVGDEEIEKEPSPETNEVDAAVGNARLPQAQPPSQPTDEPPAEERRFRRRDADSPNGEGTSERRRSRAGRRPPGAQDAPE